MRAASLRTFRKWLTGLVAGLLLVSQIAVAGQACMLAGMSGSTPAAMSEEGCVGTPMDPAACRLHCLMQDESAASPDQHLLAIPASVAAAHAGVASPVVQRLILPTRAVPPGGPPLRILYCSYLT